MFEGIRSRLSRLLGGIGKRLLTLGRIQKSIERHFDCREIAGSAVCQCRSCVPIGRRAVLGPVQFLRPDEPLVEPAQRKPGTEKKDREAFKELFSTLKEASEAAGEKVDVEVLDVVHIDEGTGIDDDEPIYFVSDLHAGDGKPADDFKDQSELFYDFVALVAGVDVVRTRQGYKPDNIYFVGDILDGWEADYPEIEAHYGNLLKCVTSENAVCGNHDADLGRPGLVKRVKQRIKQALHLEATHGLPHLGERIQVGKVVAYHGHQADPMCHGPMAAIVKRLDQVAAVLENHGLEHADEVDWWKALPGQAAHEIVTKIQTSLDEAANHLPWLKGLKEEAEQSVSETVSRTTPSWRELGHKTRGLLQMTSPARMSDYKFVEEEQKYISWTNRQLKENKSCSVLVFGHTHRPALEMRRIKLAEDDGWTRRVVANCGTWKNPPEDGGCTAICVRAHSVALIQVKPAKRPARLASQQAVGV